MALTLLMFAGDVKSSPLLTWIPVDLTAVALVLVGVAVVIRIFWGGAIVLPVGGLLILVALVPGFVVRADNPYAPHDRVSVLISIYTAVCAFMLLTSVQSRRLWIRSLAVAGLLIVPLLRMSRQGTLSVGGQGATISAAQMLGVSLIVLVVFSVTRRVRGHLSMVLTAVVVAVLGYELIGTGSRGPAIALVLSLVAVILVVRPDLVRRAMAAVLLVIAGWVILLLMGYGGAERMRLAASGSLGGSPRVALWRAALEAVPSFPAGCGWGNFWSVLTPATRLDSGYAQHAHNTVLEAFVEGGWLAGIAISALILIALRRQMWSARSNLDEAVLFAVGLFLVICSMVSGTIGDDRAMFAVVAAACAVASKRHTSPGAQVSRPGVATGARTVGLTIERLLRSGLELSFPPRWRGPEPNSSQGDSVS